MKCPTSGSQGPSHGRIPDFGEAFPEIRSSVIILIMIDNHKLINININIYIYIHIYK